MPWKVSSESRKPFQVKLIVIVLFHLDRNHKKKCHWRDPGGMNLCWYKTDSKRNCKNEDGTVSAVMAFSSFSEVVSRFTKLKLHGA